MFKLYCLKKEVRKMRSRMKKVCVLLLILLLPILFLACSGGGSSSGGGAAPTTATSLQVADKVSVVDATLSGSVAEAAPLHIGLFKVTAADLAAASDYKADKTQVWVSERSAEAFNEINNILCMLAQSKGDAMLNKGAYVALVDETQCDASKSDASSAAQDSQNQSSSTNMPDYATFTVIATRADNNSPQYLKAWVHLKQKGSDPEQMVLVNLTITEGKSETNPYGLFTMDFLGHPSTNGVMDTSRISFKGVMKAEKNAAGEVLLKFAEQNFGGWPNVRKITLNRQGDGLSGSGSVYDQHPEMISGNTTTVESQFNIAFNTNNFLRNDGTNTICLDRNQFEESAWRYGLYDTAGTRVNRNSGFSVNTRADGSGQYGFIGYWGLWIDNNVTLNNGDTLYKFDYSNNSATPYTVVKAGGKLKKHTKKIMTLAEVKGIPLNYSICDQNGCSNYQVVWNGIDQKFYKTAAMPSNCTNNCQWQNITPPVALDLTTLQWGELNFWSQSLSGQVRVPLSNCIQTFSTGSVPAPPTTTCDSPTNSTSVIFFAEDLVYPSDTFPSSFACYDNCPQIDGNGQAYINMMMSGPSNTATNYTFNTTTMLLELNGSSVTMSQASTSNAYGVMSGALFDPTGANLASLDCNWDWDNNPATNPQVCGWKAWSALNVFYTWETGPDSWNQFSALKDGTGTMLKFEPPLSVKYVHHKAGSPFDGATFMMDYSGFGNLNGIPGKCVDMETGLEAQCTNSNTIRYVPAFTIPPSQTDGSLTKVTVDTTEYLVKPLELEQRMLKVDVGNCSSLSVTPYSLPDLDTEWTDPAIGTEPVVTSAPAVIGGVVQ